MALFINPCQYPTYVNPPLRKRPSRKKRFCETNLALGGIGNIGNLPCPHTARLKAPSPQRRAWARSSASPLCWLRSSAGTVTEGNTDLCDRAHSRKDDERPRRWHGLTPVCPWARPARANPVGTRDPCRHKRDAPLAAPGNEPATNPPRTRLVTWLQ